ncbi:ABC transporter substrate-binding protein [Jutongia hominis]|jgi:putative ABC transport system substrate-binding protein|uniref:ABC transporter substrate-binding protein n=1 Tax=Jutongia hominis TaxID=2763664 RepID=A0ABR7MS89_9FIRM|nr:ABC transporter substrate-binding protein [Jutongia hominis]MBC8556664.1 ABC transporter substrate-binding protein [Jutongia hominis]PWL68613.1 MAG: ABC transporter substrate-binding protein [Clostridiaceae bacterium]
MKISKKIVSILTATALVASLTGCGSNGSSSKKYTIGICQLMEHEALDAATKGFKDTLTKKLGKDNVEFDEQNAQGESTNCSTICNGFVTSNVDLILANATGALQAATQATADIPILGTSVSDYATALNIKDWKGKTGTNVSGTSDLAPIDQQEAILKEIIPNAKKVGILYCSSEPNSAYQSKLMQEALKKDGIAYKEYTAADSNEIQSVTTTACDECDVLYVPTDNTMASSVNTIKNVAIPAGIPMIAGEKGICAAGVATLSIDYYNLGCQTGEMAYDILKNKKKAGDMEVQFAKKLTKMYNAENAKALNITIPDGYEPIESK